MTQFNPDEWTTSFFRALKTYVTGKLDTDIYDIEFAYPAVELLTKKLPIPKTIIHFDIDSMTTVDFGFGDNVVAAEYDSPSVGAVIEWEAHCHIVMLDVGIWASVESGGPSARLVATEDLSKIFHGPAARADCMTVTDGIELLDFAGGRFLPDSINDVTLFRVADMSLRVRVYSRTKKAAIPYIGGIDQSPGLLIDETVIIG